ncbi:variant erythrocyte surface antigen alpha subunit, putative [Babesia ovis]|uniref:Variant erythrocyte surface antigen alpha subunit, putative n=1 Tax=Babesia ovis TaxID=5869 RepID=A0A9W5WU10_BABOV|nr:variant erythrocyte surface antigen alpha subunit, putative [Babesia ovis]
MQFWFSYPMSETQSYYLLQDCLVGLYYQLYFLRLQCNADRQTFGGDGFGWAFCRYGDGVNGDKCGSWICPKAGAAGNEESKNYAKTLKDHTESCGTGNASPSPLQAFLTDCLKGFTCDVVRKYSTKDYKYPEFLEHRGHCPPGQYCPIPMGFRECFKKGTEGQSQAAAGQGNGMSGLGINAICAHYANDDLTDSCLYQITRCICSLTRRVPRSTGTLYGFFYGLGQVAFHSTEGQKKFKPKLIDELNCCPGWRDPECLMKAVMDWTETDHKDKHKKTQDQGNYTLGSLHACNNNTSDLTCGDYLRPLTGYLYNCLATQFCETYVSWIVHLTYRLRDGLESLLKEFRKIDCSKSGCTGKGGKGQCQCPSSGCKKGTHGITTSGSNPKGCCCESVADCVGVHGVFYRFGFSYKFAFRLAGKSGKTDKKRTCSQFVDRLKKVIIEGTYYKELQTQLRKFIYTTRALFGVYIGVYWLAVMGYLLWSMTVNLDLVHIQSHWRSPSSFLVPLQRILADGSRNMKRVCTIGYFQENTGDRLLSQGVSDVYL